MNRRSKEFIEKNELLEKQFLSLPESTITGVVGLPGPGAGRTPPAELWSLHLSLIAWKELGGQVNRSELIISKKFTRDEFKQLKTKVKHESLVQFKVKIMKDSPFGDTRAQLICNLDEPIDNELKAVLDKYKEPVELKHPEFGVLVFNKSINWFDGAISWMGSSVNISVSLDENGSPESSFNTLEALYKDSDGWSKKVTDYAVSNLLELKNDSWLRDGQEVVTASEFIGAMNLRSITVFPDGKFEFWHNDGDLFFGHSIEISGSLSKGLSHADIPG